MDKDYKRFAIKLGAIFIFIVIGYYLFSPYQKCISGLEVDYYTDKEARILICLRETTW